jgi:hypothetical protein
MASEVASRVVPSIVQLVVDSPQQSASGTRITSAIRLSFPEFSPQTEGCRNFRDFIRNFVPQLTESSQRAGMDVIYVLKAPTTSEARPVAVDVEPSSKTSGFVSLLLNNPRAWKTFASPLATSRIYVNPDGSSVLVSSAHSVPANPGWLQIEPISASSLLQIATDFIGLVPDLYRPALLESLKKPKWWIPYFDVMGSLGLKSRWVTFRRRRILDEFVRAVTEKAAEQSKLHPDDVVSGSPVASEASPECFKGEVGAEGTLAEQRLRALALAAVNRMTIAELRSLAIPLGYIADALEKKY